MTNPHYPLNHFYFTLDSDAFKSITTSDFLKDEFAACNLKSTTSTCGKYTGFYILGHQNYLEIFEEGTYESAQLDIVGIALSSNSAGDIEKLAALYNKHTPDVDRAIEMTNIIKDGKEIEWFSAFGFDYTFHDDKFYAWAMEYKESYMKMKGHTEIDGKIPIDQTTYLGDTTKGQNKERLIQDVIKFQFSITEQYEKRFASHLELMGYSLSKDGSLSTATGSPDQISFHAGESNKVEKIEFSLQKEPDSKKVIEFEGSTLTVGPGKSAVWEF
jgi:hypothetical protein